MIYSRFAMSVPYSHIMQKLYKLFKQITHREIKEIKGEEYDRYFKAAENFVTRMREFIE